MNRVAISLTMLCLAAPAFGQYAIPWSTIDGGGGQASGGPFVLQGTIGQPDAGVQSGGAFALVGGFWGIARRDDCPADFNHDGNVNLFDFLAFQTAFGNEDAAADLAAPFGTFNLFDFLAFQTAFGNGC